MLDFNIYERVSCAMVTLDARDQLMQLNQATMVNQVEIIAEDGSKLRAHDRLYSPPRSSTAGRNTKKNMFTKARMFPVQGFSLGFSFRHPQGVPRGPTILAAGWPSRTSYISPPAAAGKRYQGCVCVWIW